MKQQSAYEAEVTTKMRGVMVGDVPDVESTFVVNEYTFVRQKNNYFILVFRHGEFAYCDGRNAFNALLSNAHDLAEEIAAAARKESLLEAADLVNNIAACNADVGDHSAAQVEMLLVDDLRAMAKDADKTPGWFEARVVDRLRGLDTEKRVRFYEHDFYPLSNFSAFSIMWHSKRFDTSEHVYHWEKFRPTMADIRRAIHAAPSAHDAFQMAQFYKKMRRPDWDEVKVGIMRGILRAKLQQHEYVRRKLLATGDRELVEDSWRDDFWGWGPNRDGQNMLGKLWMELRAELRLSEADAT